MTEKNDHELTAEVDFHQEKIIIILLKDYNYYFQSLLVLSRLHAVVNTFLTVTEEV